VEKLAKAGLSFVFLQFDSLDDAVYEELRGRPLAALKEQAIANCADHRIGVTLVPTLIPGVNTHEVGDIIHFAVQHSPAVRGVHFQPVSYFGRSPIAPHLAPRYTLDELLHDIVSQGAGLVKVDDFSPSRCDHPLCGLHGDFIIMPNCSVIAMNQYRTADKEECCEPACCCSPPAPDAAAKNRAFVARYWQRSKDDENCCCSGPVAFHNEVSSALDLTDMEQFAARVKSHGFTITAMAFQDAATMDIARLRQCSLHVYDANTSDEGGRHVPFCAYYL
jgi:uncharacterized radical SAM superfamily Fe-S cluster-containing enzyme